MPEQKSNDTPPPELPKVTIRGWGKLPRSTQLALAAMVELAIASMERGDFDLKTQTGPGTTLGPATGKLCPKCGEPQYMCRSGIVCKNGHGY